MNLQDLHRKLIRLSGGVLTRGAAAFEGEHPSPKPRQFAGLRVMVENPAGSVRSGVSKSGKAWSVRMKHDYGFLPRATGADGEGLDVFLNATPCRCDGNHENVYVVHQNDPATGRYDEDKVMLGFHNPDEAKAAYLANYDRPDFFRSMTILPMATFRGMLTNGAPGGVAWKRKHGREHAAAAMFAAGEGRWVTIGSDKSAPPGEKGGTPVYIGKDGTIEAGPQRLEGRNVSNLKEPAKPKQTAPQPKPTAAATKVQPLTSEQLHERVKALRAAGKPMDLAVAQARRESQQPKQPTQAEQAKSPELPQGGPHAEIEAKYGPKSDKPLADTTAEEAASLKVADRFRAGGRDYTVDSVQSQERSEPLTHPTDPASTLQGERKVRITSVRGVTAQGPTKPFTFKQVLSEHKPWENEDDPVTVQAATEGAPGEAIPPPPAAAVRGTAVTSPAKEKTRSAKPRGEPAAIPPQVIRRRILERYEQENGRGIPEEAWDVANGMQDPWTFSRKDGLKGERNTMLREGGKDGAAMALSGAVTVAARGGAEDAINELKERYGAQGEDLYWRMAKARAGSGFDDALEYARKHDDPQMRFLAALHDITPTRKQDRIPQEKVPADQLAIDHEFKVQGVQVKVTENEDGERVLIDHGALPETPVEALDEVPVDKGSMRETELPDVGEAGDDPFGDLPPAEPEEQPVGEVPDAGDGEEDHAGDELGEGAASGTGHAQSVPDVPSEQGAEESPASPTSDNGVFGQEILRPATGKNQGGLFHEPVEVRREETERVGSRSANDPRHTVQMFPPTREEEGPAKGAAPPVAAEDPPHTPTAASPPQGKDKLLPGEGKALKKRIKQIQEASPGTSFRAALARAYQDLKITPLDPSRAA
jgi:hypothetical protein